MDKVHPARSIMAEEVFEQTSHAAFACRSLRFAVHIPEFSLVNENAFPSSMRWLSPT